MNETWKEVKNYEGIYEVSNLGNIRSLDRIIEDSMGRKRKYKGIVLKSGNSKGYLKIDLKYKGSSKTVKVHRLVAQAFINNYSEKLEVNHIDGIKTNNIVTNLQCITTKENIQHAHRIGLHSSDRPIYAINIVTEKIVEYQSQREAARQLNIPSSNVSNIINGIQNSAKGYIFIPINKDCDIDKAIINAKKRIRSKKVKVTCLETKKVLYFNTQTEAAKILKVNPNSISKIISGKQIATKGYTFTRV